MALAVLNFLGFIPHNHTRPECETMKPRTRKATALPVQHILLKCVSAVVCKKTAEKKTAHVFQSTKLKLV